MTVPFLLPIPSLPSEHYSHKLADYFSFTGNHLRIISVYEKHHVSTPLCIVNANSVHLRTFPVPFTTGQRFHPRSFDTNARDKKNNNATWKFYSKAFVYIRQDVGSHARAYIRSVSRERGILVFSTIPSRARVTISPKKKNLYVTSVSIERRIREHRAFRYAPIRL